MDGLNTNKDKSLKYENPFEMVYSIKQGIFILPEYDIYKIRYENMIKNLISLIELGDIQYNKSEILRDLHKLSHVFDNDEFNIDKLIDRYLIDSYNISTI
jgi:hypothetical protein